MDRFAIGMRRSGAALLLTLALIALFASAAAARGISPLLKATPNKIGPRTTIQNNYEQTTTTTSIAPPAAGPCTNSFGCFFLFSRVPLGKQLIVTQVSCRGFPTQPVLWALIAALAPDGSAPLRSQALTSPGNLAGAFAVNNTTLQLYAAREQPIVLWQLNASGNVQTGATCTIAGRLVDAPK